MRYFVLSLLASSFLWIAPGERALAEPAITITNVGFSVTNPPFTLGWEFDVLDPISVTALGVFDDSQDGLVDRHPIGIWDSGGTLLASTTVSSGTADPLVDQFRSLRSRLSSCRPARTISGRCLRLATIH